MRQYLAAVRSLLGRTFGRKRRGLDLGVQEARWTVATSSSEDQFAVIRIVEGQLEKREWLTAEIQVIVPSLGIDLATTTAPKPLLAELARFEDRLSYLLRTVPSILAAVVTLRHERSFLIYTADARATERGLEALRQEFPHLTIKHEVADANDWSTYRHYLSLLTDAASGENLTSNGR